MSKVTSKYQVSVPKTLAEQYHIHPGDDLAWEAAGDVMRVIPPRADVQELDRHQRLWLFDQATKRQQERNKKIKPHKKSVDRGWTREELYDDRGRTG